MLWGRRIKKTYSYQGQSGTISGNIISIYGPGGELLADYTNENDNISRTDYILYGSQAIARRIVPQSGSATVQDLYRNHLNQVFDLSTYTVTTGLSTMYGIPFRSGGNDQFSGHKDDPESGLHYNLARSFDPVIARWISPDPIVGNAYDPQSLNKYGYVRNDPVNRIDPDGRQFDPTQALLYYQSLGWNVYDAVDSLANLPGVSFNFTKYFYLSQWAYEGSSSVLWDAAIMAGISYATGGSTGSYGGTSGGGGGGSSYSRQDLVNLAKQKGLRERAKEGSCANFLNGVIANLARLPAGFSIDTLIKNIQSANINPSGLGENGNANTRDGNTINLGGQAYVTAGNGSDLLSRLFHEGFHLKSSGGVGGVGLTPSFRDESQLAAAAAWASGVDPTRGSFKLQDPSTLISQYFGSACGGGWSP